MLDINYPRPLKGHPRYVPAPATAETSTSNRNVSCRPVGHRLATKSFSARRGIYLVITLADLRGRGNAKWGLCLQTRQPLSVVARTQNFPDVLLGLEAVCSVQTVRTGTPICTCCTKRPGICICSSQSHAENRILCLKSSCSINCRVVVPAGRPRCLDIGPPPPPRHRPGQILRPRPRSAQAHRRARAPVKENTLAWGPIHPI